MSTSSTCLVELDGQPLPADVEPLLVSAQIDDSQQLPDSFTLRFRDPARMVLSKTGATVGSTVTLKVQTSDASGPATLLKGEVTAFEAEFDGSGSFTLIRGYDQAHRFLRNRRTMSFVQMTASDIATKIARAAGLQIGVVTATSTVYPHVSQAGQTDWEVLSLLARTSGCEITVRDGKFGFAKPGDAKTAPAAGSPSTPNPLVLMQGRDLLRFRSVVTSAQQVSEVEVRGWDVATKKALVATAPAKSRTLDLPSVRPDSVGRPFGQARYVSAEVPYRSQAEVEGAAAALAEQLASSFAEFEGVVRGNPDVRAGRAVTVDGVGEPFDGKYTVTTSRHRFDPDTGYTTSFAVTGRSDRSLLGLTGGATRVKAPPGLAVAQVSDAADPEKSGRVRLTFPWLSDDYVSDWARTVQSGAGKGRGSAVLPEVGDEVLVGFEQGDFGRPTVLGGLYNGVDTMAAGQGDLVDSGSGKVNRRSHVSRLGHRMDLLDGSDASGVRIATADDKLLLFLDQTKTAITVHADGKITIEGSKGITLDAGSEAVEIKGGSIELTASQGVKIDGGGGKVELKTGGQLELKGAMTKFASDGMAEVSSSGILTVKGSLVKIN